jgi:hypothetical protein
MIQGLVVELRRELALGAERAHTMHLAEQTLATPTARPPNLYAETPLEGKNDVLVPPTPLAGVGERATPRNRARCRELPVAARGPARSEPSPQLITQ